MRVPTAKLVDVLKHEYPLGVAAELFANSPLGAVRFELTVDRHQGHTGQTAGGRRVLLLVEVAAIDAQKGKATCRLAADGTSSLTNSIHQKDNSTHAQ